MKVQVHKCRITGKLFEDKDRAKYILHLKAMRTKQKELRLHEKIRKEFAVWLAKERSEIYDPNDIIPWFMKNQRYIMDAANALKFPDDKKYQRGFHPDDKFTDIELRIKYSPCVSNSHQCPDNGITNWCAKNPGVTSYPGWEGYINGTLVRPSKYNWSYPYSEALEIVGLKTGTGGGGNDSWNYGGNDSWNYDVKVFLDDWPGLGQILVVNKLKGVF